MVEGGAALLVTRVQQHLPRLLQAHQALDQLCDFGQVRHPRRPLEHRDQHSRAVPKRAGSHLHTDSTEGGVKEGCWEGGLVGDQGPSRCGGRGDMGWLEGSRVHDCGEA